jgi:hypothetical protein
MKEAGFWLVIGLICWMLKGPLEEFTQKQKAKTDQLNHIEVTVDTIERQLDNIHRQLIPGS